MNQCIYVFLLNTETLMKKLQVQCQAFFKKSTMITNNSVCKMENSSIQTFRLKRMNIVQGKIFRLLPRNSLNRLYQTNFKKAIINCFSIINNNLSNNNNHNQCNCLIIQHSITNLQFNFISKISNNNNKINNNNIWINHQ